MNEPGLSREVTHRDSANPPHPLPEGKPAGNDRTAAGQAAAERMRELGLSVAELARRSGLAENTIRGMTRGINRHNKSSWVAISAVLRFEPDYLFNILNGEADRNVTDANPLATYLEYLAHGISDIGTLREDAARVTNIVRTISDKIDAVAGHPFLPDSEPQHRENPSAPDPVEGEARRGRRAGRGAEA